MDTEASVPSLVRAYVLPRVVLVGGAALVGVGGGVVLLVALSLVGFSPVGGARTAFALSSLTFGVGLLGWSGSAMAGRGFEAMQEHLDTNTNWTEDDSRRAMARIGGFGAGAMTTTGVAYAVALAG